MEEEGERIVSIETQTGDVDDFVLKLHTPMKAVITRWYKIKNLEKTRSRFLFDGDTTMDDEMAVSVRQIESL
jgi:hypothetical protein